MAEPLPRTASPRPARAGQRDDTLELSPLTRWLGFASLMLGLFTIISASTSISTAIPDIQRSLHAGLSQVEWFVDSYLIVLTVSLTTFGRLGDLFGRRRLFVAGGIFFIVGSILSGLSSNATFLIVFRGVTALGPAMMMPATLSLITDLFPPSKRGLPMGLWGSMVGVAIGLGPLMGGVFAGGIGWRWVFWGSAVLGVGSLLLALVLLPQSRPADRRPTLDLPGLILNAGFVFCITFALVEGHDHGWTSVLILGLFGGSALLLVLFVWRERSARDPLVNPALFRERAFSAGILVTATLMFGLFAIFVYLPLYLQGVLGESPVKSGLTLLPMAAAMACAGPVGGYLAGRMQPRWPISAALGSFAVGTFWLAHLSVSTSWQSLVLPFVVMGIGLGVASANLNTAVMHAVPRREAGAAAGVVATVRQLGSALGVSIFGAVLQHRQSTHAAEIVRQNRSAPNAPAYARYVETHALTAALNDTFLVCAAVLVTGALVALLVRREQRL